MLLRLSGALIIISIFIVLYIQKKSLSLRASCARFSYMGAYTRARIQKVRHFKWGKIISIHLGRRIIPLPYNIRFQMLLFYSKLKMVIILLNLIVTLSIVWNCFDYNKIAYRLKWCWHALVQCGHQCEPVTFRVKMLCMVQ